MTDQELRALVRDAVARHLGPESASAAAAPMPAAGARALHFSSAPGHPSHAVYISVVNVDDACVIEPSVPCNHCNYCKSHGH